MRGHACMHTDQHITEILRVMTCTRGDPVPADYTIVNTNRNLLYKVSEQLLLAVAIALQGEWRCIQNMLSVMVSRFSLLLFFPPTRKIAPFTVFSASNIPEN